MGRETSERYIETIRGLGGMEKRARTKDIAEELGVKEASVTEMLRKLKVKKLVEYEPYRGVILTARGRRLAEILTRKHNTLAEFLKVIGVRESIADADACKIEHIAHPRTIEKLQKFVEFVEGSPEKPTWLEHYRYFVKTGKRLKCKRRKNDE